MSCCTKSRSTYAPQETVSPQSEPNTAEIGEIADASAPERACFQAGEVGVGTSDPAIPEDGEGPPRQVYLEAFALDTEAVTNARFAAFVADTGYTTDSEHIGWAPVFRSLLADPEAAQPSGGNTPWWIAIPGACWFAPEGKLSNIAHRANHPVTHVSWNDARAFTQWAGGRLPSEAEWEHAARGGLEDPRFPWGNAEPTDETVFCNIWQGHFPVENTLADGYLATAPARSFEPNGAGLYNMAGNIWEWTTDPFYIHSSPAGAGARNDHAQRQDEKLLKGGSFLCHLSYCYRYRIAARMGLPSMDSASNTGFRVAYDQARPSVPPNGTV